MFIRSACGVKLGERAEKLMTEAGFKRVSQFGRMALKNKIKKRKKTVRENLKILKDNTYCENIKYNEDNFKMLGFKFLNKIKIH